MAQTNVQDMEIGKQITQTGATFIVALRKLHDEWRIGAWAWAKGTAQAQA